MDGKTKGDGSYAAHHLHASQQVLLNNNKNMRKKEVLYLSY